MRNNKSESVLAIYSVSEEMIGMSEYLANNEINEEDRNILSKRIYMMSCILNKAFFTYQQAKIKEGN